MKLISRILVLLVFLQLLIQCTPDNETNEYDISGKAQKGPFVIGTNVTISELDNNLKPTGKVYFSTIMNNEGFFDIPDVEFVSDYIQLKIEGNHYNENRGLTFTNEPITLYCLADLTNLTNTNINLLTHLEKDLVIKYKQEGKSFQEAKRNAQKDILAVFNLDKYTMEDSEILDISEAGNGNGILLALTTVIQGNLSGMRLTGFLTRLRGDINDNGSIDSEDLQTQLICQAKMLYPPVIRGNLENFYSGLGKEYTIPNFEESIDVFIDNSLFKSTVDYTIPESTENGINLLGIDSDTIYIDTSITYSLSVRTDENSKIGFNASIGRLWGSEDWFEVDNISDWIFPEIEYGNNFFDLGIYNQPNTVADARVQFKGEGLANMHIYVYLGDYQILSYGIDRTLIWGK